ncbi:MAG TPA: 2'-5' RNA ligase family protein [Hanamia sp.]|nr:2'-5' RNA ligase family protein [Hanamia sp.]
MQNNLLIKMPGYRQIEYIIILNPHQSLREKIMKVRNNFYSKYSPAIQLNSKPNIRLARFFSFEMMEEKLINHLKMIAMGMPPFKASLKDYGSFPAHTLFINVSSKIPLQMLVKDLRSTRRLIKSPDQEPYFTNEFYIPIAIRLSPEQYEKAWQEYSHRQFTGSFIADSMLLLKRKTGEKNYQIAERFEFMNLPVSVRQGELFA